MITGHEIMKRVENGSIIIEPFREEQVNPNSYNIRLGNKLLTYDISEDGYLDPRKKTPTKEIIIPEEGLLLQPGELYLGETVEIAGSDELITNIDGRSSTGRNGLFIHITAGFGDIGFVGKWTLEIVATIPTLVFPNMEIGQIYFTLPYGKTTIMYKGKYQNATGVEASKTYKDYI